MNHTINTYSSDLKLIGISSFFHTMKGFGKPSAAQFRMKLVPIITVCSSNVLDKNTGGSMNKINI